MRAFLGYTGARLAMFLGCWAILWLVGAKGFLGAILAMLVSGLLSFVVLDKLRGRLAASVTGAYRSLRRDRPAEPPGS